MVGKNRIVILQSNCAIFFSQNGHCIKLGHDDILYSCQDMPVYGLDSHQKAYSNIFHRCWVAITSTWKMFSLFFNSALELLIYVHKCSLLCKGEVVNSHLEIG